MIAQATIFKQIQLENTSHTINNGTIKKIFIGDRYFFIFANNNIHHDDNVNLLLFYHGSRDIAMNCALSSTSLIETFGNTVENSNLEHSSETKNKWIIAFGQCDGVIQDPYIHKGYGKIAYGEIYWGITGVQNLHEDIEYTKNLIEILEKTYKINKKVMMGHSNGGVFSLLMPIYLPNVFDLIVSHQGGLGFDPLFGLDFYLVKSDDKKPKILFYTGTLDMHKSVCEIARNIFLAEKYCADIIIIDNLDHNYKKECEIVIKKWIDKCFED